MNTATGLLLTRTTFIALFINVLVFLAGLLIGYSSLDGLPLVTATNGADETTWSLGSILVRNLGACFLLYSGVLTGGALSIISMAAVSVYVGATAKVGALAAGLGPVITSSLWYVPLEFGGLLLAAGAGLYPIIAANTRQFQLAHGGSLRAYLRAIPQSLVLLAAGAVLILAGAGVETIVMSVQEG